VSARVVRALVLAAAAWTGCKRRPPPAELVEDGWSEVRRELLSGAHCFAGRPEYCVADEAFVDRAIRSRLDALYGGEMPLRRAHVEATKRAAVVEYKRLMTAPDGVAKVAEAIEARYLEPRVAVGASGVAIDFGVVPGKLSGHPGAMEITLDESSLAADGWLEAEARHALALYARTYPDARVLRIEVVLPTKTGLGRYVYRYSRVEKRVFVVEPSKRMRRSRQVPTDDALASVELALSGLVVCAVDGAESVDRPLCPSDLPVIEPPASAGLNDPPSHTTAAP
jgi:hypothetical protein